MKKNSQLPTSSVEKLEGLLYDFLSTYNRPSDNPLEKSLPLDYTSSDDVISIENLPFCSICKHDLVPFFGKIHIAFIPSGLTLGLNHFHKYIDYCSKQLHLQENLGYEIAQGLYETLHPRALVVKIEAFHSCLVLKDHPYQNAKLKTFHYLGDQTHQSKLTLHLNEFGR